MSACDMADGSVMACAMAGAPSVAMESCHGSSVSAMDCCGMRVAQETVAALPNKDASVLAGPPATCTALETSEDALRGPARTELIETGKLRGQHRNTLSSSLLL